MRELDVQIDDFMLECETKGLSKRTMISYKGTIRLLDEFKKKESGIEDANDVRGLYHRMEYHEKSLKIKLNNG